MQGCGWCGGPIVQPPQGRRRLYCKAGHREMAYRARATQRRVDEALKSAGAQLAEQSVKAAVVGEACPYCGDQVLHVVAHMRTCDQRPDSSTGDSWIADSIS